ncbi:MAG: hypothetical protein WBQ37_12545 [Candidatus Competibacter sp.]
MMHAAAQGVVVGANMVLVGFPSKTGQGAGGELGWFLDDLALARECYKKRLTLSHQRRGQHTGKAVHPEPD